MSITIAGNSSRKTKKVLNPVMRAADPPSSAFVSNLWTAGPVTSPRRQL